MADMKRQGDITREVVYMTVEEAKQYINLGIKEGYFSEEQFKDMTDDELIEFAESKGQMGDYYADMIAGEKVKEDGRKDTT